MHGRIANDAAVGNVAGISDRKTDGGLRTLHAAPRSIKFDVAYDVQPEMLDIVRRRTAELCLENFSAASWEETQARAPYDRIIALNVLHEIDDATLRSIAPLLAPQGDVLIFDWDATIDRPTGPPAEHAHSPAEGWDRIARSGLRCIERIRDPRFPYHFIVRAARRT